MGWESDLKENEDLQDLWGEIIGALTPHVKVKLIVNSESLANDARNALKSRGIDANTIQFVVQPTTDMWLRDSGALFVTDGETLCAADFAWNYYGFPSPFASVAGHARGAVDDQIIQSMGIERYESRVVAEGGGLEVNSSVLITYKDAIQVRNPSLTLAEIESELLRLYGKEKLLWLDRAPISDRVFAGPKVENFFGWGANGHVDEYVRFVDEKTILVAQVSEGECDSNALLQLDDEILRENMEQLKAATDADGQSFHIIKAPMPDITALMQTKVLTAEDFIDPNTGMDQRLVYRDFEIGDKVHMLPAASYLNFLVTNGVVLVAAYWKEGLPDRLKETDEEMRRLLSQYYPNRQIVQINPIAINWWGGGIHCLTQQEPMVDSSKTK